MVEKNIKFRGNSLQGSGNQKANEILKLVTL